MEESSSTRQSSPRELEEATNGGETPAGYGPALLKRVRRLLVFVLGISVVAVGIVMIVAPGPAFVVIPLGLGILATEFLWARRVLDHLKQRLIDAHAAATQAPLPGWMWFLLPKKETDRES